MTLEGVHKFEGRLDSNAIEIQVKQSKIGNKKNCFSRYIYPSLCSYLHIALYIFLILKCKQTNQSCKLHMATVRLISGNALSLKDIAQQEKLRQFFWDIQNASRNCGMLVSRSRTTCFSFEQTFDYMYSSMSAKEHLIYYFSLDKTLAMTFKVFKKVKWMLVRLRK